MSYATAQYGFERDLARDFAEYAKQLDTAQRESRGIIIFLGSTPDQDRAYEFPVQYAKGLSTDLRRFETFLATNQDTRYLFVLGADKDDDTFVAVDPNRFDNIQARMPEGVQAIDFPLSESAGLSF